MTTERERVLERLAADGGARHRPGDHRQWKRWQPTVTGTTPAWFLGDVDELDLGYDDGAGLVAAIAFVLCVAVLAFALGFAAGKAL